MKLKSKKQFIDYIGENCYINNVDGTVIGSTSGGFKLLFYLSETDHVGIPLKGWDEAYAFYRDHNKALHSKRLPKNSDLLRYGAILQVNNFETKRGYYTIRIIQYNGAIYYHKMKNGKVVEIKKFTP